MEWQTGGPPKHEMERIDVIYEMILKKNPASPTEYWSALLDKLENEANMGWSIVSPEPDNERSKVVKQIVLAVHQALEENENARG